MRVRQRRIFRLAPFLLLPVVGCTREIPRIDRVILVTLDTTRADHLGCYGHAKAATPVLDRLAAEDGVVFEQAVAPTPTTLPSHATILTGLYPPDHGVRYNMFFRLAPSVVTLAEKLRDAGFATAAFPASHVVARRFGLDQGFETWEEPPSPEASKEQGREEHPLETMRRAAEGVDLALRWLDARSADRMFVWLHLYDPHWPYVPPFPFSGRFRERSYDGEIAYADSELGRLIERLRADPEWSRTVVVVVGDHGEGLFDHGERYHALLVYEATQRVPFLVRAPGARASRVAEPVTLADVAPTVLDLTGVPAIAPTRGISLRPALQGEALPRRDIYFESLTGSIVCGWAELTGVRQGNWKLIDSSSPELFDLASDPDESANLATRETGRLEELRRALRDLSRPISADAPAEASAGIEVDERTEALLASLGYVSGSTGRSSSAETHPRDFVYLYPELLAAQAAVSGGRWNRVEEISAYILEKDPKNLWALAGLARARIHSNRPREAIDPARRLLERSPKEEQAFALLAYSESESGRPKESLAVLERGVKELPDSKLLAYLRLVAAFESGVGTVCGEMVPAAAKRFADSGEILVLRARCEARSGNPQAALATIEEASRKGFDRVATLRDSPDFAAVVRLDGFERLAATDGGGSASAPTGLGPR